MNKVAGTGPQSSSEFKVKTTIYLMLLNASRPLTISSLKRVFVCARESGLFANLPHAHVRPGTLTVVHGLKLHTAYYPVKESGQKFPTPT